MIDRPVPPNRRRLLAGLAATVCTPSAFALMLNVWPFTQRSPRKPLLIAGTGTMYALNEALAQAFRQRHPDVDVVVERGGAMSALIALRRGSIDVAASDHDLKPQDDEKGLRSFLVARNGVGVVVHQGLGIRNLTAQQIRGIVAGQITHWNQLGGPNAKIQIVTRASGTSARRFIEDMLLDGADFVTGSQEQASPQAVMATVAQDRYAIGFVLLKDRESVPQISFISIDGVAATRETLLTNRYPFTQSLYFNVFGDAPAQATMFVDFSRSEAGQRIVESMQFVGTY